MKSHISSTLFASVATLVSLGHAQTEQTPPFILSISASDNGTLVAYGLLACHAGAAIEGLCLDSAKPTVGDASATYYQNYSSSSPEPVTGPLVWNLPITGPDGPITVASPMSFNYNPGSNVAVPLFEPSDTYQYVGFDADNKMYVPGSYDDSTFIPGTAPVISGTPAPLYNWHVCWTEVGSGYYYQVLTWVTTGTPHNPTCVAANVTRSMA